MVKVNGERVFLKNCGKSQVGQVAVVGGKVIGSYRLMEP